MLQDEHRLDHYRIESGHTIHMVARPANATPVGSPEGRAAAESVSTGAAPGGNPVQVTRLGSADLMALLNPLQGLGLGGLNEILQGGGRSMEPVGPARDSHSLEHIRQSLLTIHSIRASIPHVVSIGGSDAPEEAQRDEDSGEQDDVDMPRVFYRQQWIDVKDTVNQWLEATVMDILEEDRRIFVHYNGWYICSLNS